MILNVDFALKLSNFTSLRRFICLKKKSLEKFSIILSSTNIHFQTLPLTFLCLDFSVLSLYAKSDQDFSVFSSDLASTGCKYEWCTYIPKELLKQVVVLTGSSKS